MTGVQTCALPIYTINTRQTLTNLRPNTTYEYRVKCICGVNSSDYAKADTFHTRQIAQSTMLSCGQTPLKETIDSTKKLAALHKGDEVTIQDFVMTIVEASGSNGRFSGMATIPIKMLNTTLYTEFKNIGINDQYQVYAGSVKVTSGMIALLPPDLKAKVLEKYNEIIAIGDEIDNGLGKADQIITKGTEIYNKATDIYDDVKDKVNSADKLKDGTKDIKSGIDAANDGDTTKGKSLIKKGIDAIDKALNGIEDAGNSLFGGLEKIKPFIIELLRNKKDTSDKGIDNNLTKVNDKRKRRSSHAKKINDKNKVFVLGENTHYTSTPPNSINEPVAQNFSKEQISILSKNSDFANYFNESSVIQSLEDSLDYFVSIYKASEYFLDEGHLNLILTDLSEDFKSEILKSGTKILEDAFDGKNPEIKERIIKIIDKRMSLYISESKGK